MKVIVIGGGASGLVSAIKMAKMGREVTILERNNKCGKKLLLTGNGRCNYFNINQELSNYHSTNLEVLKEIITKENLAQVLLFFKNLGIVPKIKNGYFYPFSMQASSIYDALMQAINNLGIKVVTEEKVLDLKKEDNKFFIKGEKHNYEADMVVIATGSKALPKSGSDGLGYDLVTKFKHTIIPVLPALVQLEGKNKFYHDWAGVRAEVKLELWEDEEKIMLEAGEAQFTDYGISGICVFNLSSLIARGLNENKKEVINIDFVPWYEGSDQEFKTWLDHQNKTLNNFPLSQILEGFLNKKIVNLILKLLHIASNENWVDVDQDELINLLRHFPFEVVKTKDFPDAQVCSGGVSLKEINPLTMESKKCPNLFLTGEILDVDGKCGGYNLTFAWTTGLIVGGQDA